MTKLGFCSSIFVLSWASFLLPVPASLWKRLWQQHTARLRAQLRLGQQMVFCTTFALIQGVLQKRFSNMVFYNCGLHFLTENYVSYHVYYHSFLQYSRRLRLEIRKKCVIFLNVPRSKFYCPGCALAAKIFCCQYQYNWLPGKTRLRKDLLRVEWDVNRY